MAAAVAVAVLCGSIAAAQPAPPSFEPQAAADPDDWPQRKFDAAATAFNAAETKIGAGNVANLKEKWRKPLTSGVDGAPVVAAGRLYVASGTKLLALDLKKGRTVWTRDFEFAYVEGAPAVANGLVFTTNGDRYLYALDAANGKQKWRAPLPASAFKGEPVVSGGVVYVGCSDHKLYAFSVKKGNQLWATDLRDSRPSSPAVAQSGVFSMTPDGVLHKLDRKSGKELWYKKAGILSVGTPAVVGGAVYVGAAPNVSAFDASTGDLLWSTETAGTAMSPAFADGVVVTAANSGHVYAMDPATGVVIWDVDVDAYSDVSVANGVVYVASISGALLALELKTGLLKWSKQTGKPLALPATISRGEVYFGSGDLSLYALKLRK